jgi:hypothetical protein
MEVTPFQDAVFAPFAAGDSSIPPSARNFRMGVPASTPFIGPGENNFSHIF